MLEFSKLAIAGVVLAIGATACTPERPQASIPTASMSKPPSVTGVLDPWGRLAGHATFVLDEPYGSLVTSWKYVIALSGRSDDREHDWSVVLALDTPIGELPFGRTFDVTGSRVGTTVISDIDGDRYLGTSGSVTLSGSAAEFAATVSVVVEKDDNPQTAIVLEGSVTGSSHTRCRFLAPVEGEFIDEPEAQAPPPANAVEWVEDPPFASEFCRRYAALVGR